MQRHPGCHKCSRGTSSGLGGLLTGAGDSSAGAVEAACARLAPQPHGLAAAGRAVPMTRSTGNEEAPCAVAPGQLDLEVSRPRWRASDVLARHSKLPSSLAGRRLLKVSSRRRPAQLPRRRARACCQRPHAPPCVCCAPTPAAGQAAGSLPGCRAATRAHAACAGSARGAAPSSALPGSGSSGDGRRRMLPAGAAAPGRAQCRAAAA